MRRALRAQLLVIRRQAGPCRSPRVASCGHRTRSATASPRTCTTGSSSSWWCCGCRWGSPGRSCATIRNGSRRSPTGSPAPSTSSSTSCGPRGRPCSPPSSATGGSAARCSAWPPGPRPRWTSAWIPTRCRACPDVEANAYFLASEALANAFKHAQASQVEVEVTLHRRACWSCASVTTAWASSPRGCTSGRDGPPPRPRQRARRHPRGALATRPRAPPCGASAALSPGSAGGRRGRRRPVGSARSPPRARASGRWRWCASRPTGG
jgi:hypothetical protein